MEKTLKAIAPGPYFGLMSIHRDSGIWGEEAASAYLEQQGFELLERNWRYRRLEIDIISKEKGILVFTEVKTRKNIAFGRPEEMVNRRKQEMLVEAAMAYMRKIHFEWEIRFDIVAIVGQPGRIESITLFRDAFFPGIIG